MVLLESAEADSIIKALSKLETGFLAAFWSCVLNRTNMTSKLLLYEKADLGSSCSDESSSVIE